MNNDNEKIKEIKKDIKKLSHDITNIVKQIMYCLIISIFLGSFYYFFRWKFIGALLLFVICYGLLGVLLVLIAFCVQLIGFKIVKNKEKKGKDNDLDF